MFWDKCDEWNKKPVETFESGDTLDLEARCYRLEGEDFEDNVEEFFGAVDGPVRELVIGPTMDVPDLSNVQEILLPHVGALQHCEALFIGDVSQEEGELSWIELGDLGTLVAKLPLLSKLYCRGGAGLRFQSIRGPNLRSLVIESAAIEPRAVRDLMTHGRHLPNLEVLHLSIGEEAGWVDFPEVSPVDFEPMLYWDLFPKLRELGICNWSGINDMLEYMAGPRAMAVDELAGKTVCLDTDEPLADALAKAGAKVVRGFLINADLIVTTDEKWNSHYEARHLGVPTILDSDLEELLEGGDLRGPAPLLGKLAELDVSQGTLSDEGFEALARHPQIASLERLVVDEHYASDGWIAHLESLGVEVDGVRDPGQYAPPDDRYIAISE